MLIKHMPRSGKVALGQGNEWVLDAHQTKPKPFQRTVDRNMNSKGNSEKDLLFLALCTYIRDCW